MQIKGNSIAITGIIEGMSRTQAAQAITERGGHHVPRYVNGGTDYLVIAKKPHHYKYGRFGQKAALAAQYGATVVSVTEFLEALKKETAE